MMLVAGGPADRRKAMDFFVQEPFAVLDVAAGVAIAAIPLKLAAVGVAGIRAGRGAILSNKAAEVAFEASRGIARPSLLQRTKEIGQAALRGITREFAALPNTPQFERFRFDIQNLKKQRGISADKAIDDIDRIIKGFTKEDNRLFSYKVAMDDILEQRKRDPNSSLVHWGNDLDSFMDDYNKINAKVSESPIVSEALVKRKEMWDNLKPAYIQSLKDVGFDVEKRFTRENYFHRMVIEYARTKAVPGGGIRTPTARGFLKARTGSSKLFNTDYIQAEYSVLSQMRYDIEVANLVKSIDANYNIGGKIDAAPSGYVEWQPREGNLFFTAETLPHRMVEDIHVNKLYELLDGVEVDGVKVTADDLRGVLAMGGRRKTFIIPEEIKNTIDEIGKKNIRRGAFAEATKGALTKWKAWTLLSPRRFLKYNIRNLTGDADFAFLGNMSGFKMTPRATRELYDYFKNRKSTPDLQDWIDRGGLGSTMQVQEIGDINRLDRFSRLAEKPNLAVSVAKGYWRKVRISTDMREGVLRYANYLDYKRQMGLNPEGKPLNFGASVRENVMALDNVGDRAFALSNDLLGAYDRVSVAGQFLREYLYPFWSWKEVNLKRYIQATRNAAQDGTMAMAVGKTLAGKALRSPYMALQMGRFATKAVAMQSSLQAWNTFVMGDLEENLPASVRGTSHLVLGTDKDGNTIYFSRMGALNDALEWVGLDAMPLYYDRISKGQMTYKQMAQEMVKSPVNVLAQGIRPDIKTLAELAARQAFFPDVFKGRLIRDKAEHVSRVFGLENEYKALTGKPAKDYLSTFADLAVYRINPNEAAYRNLWDARVRYLDSIGKGGIGFWASDKGNALYNMKQSLRYKDPIAFTHYLEEYFAKGGKTTGILSSVKGMHPLSGMSEASRAGLVEWIGKGAEDMITQANQYFEEVITVDDEFLIKVEDILSAE